MKRFTTFLFLIACAMPSIAQAFFGEKPKLVVGIAVDQMRWDNLDRLRPSDRSGALAEITQ